MWFVIAVNQVMSNARMVGLYGKQFLEDRGCLLSIGKGRIVVRIRSEGFSQRRDEFLNIYLDVIFDRKSHRIESTNLR